MKNVLMIGFVTVALTFSGTVAAQENQENQESQESTQTKNDLQQLQLYYDTELFHWDATTFGGLQLNFKNQSSSPYWFGIKHSAKSALLQYEDSGRQYRSYRGKTIAGNIMMWGGFATAITPAFFNLNNLNDTQRYAILGTMTGGLLIEFIGIFFLSSGQADLINAANLYNRHKMLEYK